MSPALSPWSWGLASTHERDRSSSQGNSESAELHIFLRKKTERNIAGSKKWTPPGGLESGPALHNLL